MFRMIKSKVLVLMTALFMALTIVAPASATTVPPTSGACHDWMQANLSVVLFTDYDGQPGVVLSRHEDGSVAGATTLNWFCFYFGETIADESKTDKYYWLSDPNLHTFVWEGTTYQRTATQLGYQSAFDWWHSEGWI